MPGGEKVDLFEFPGYNCCPVQALKNLRAKQIQAGNTDESLPVFRFLSGKNLTCAIMNKTLADLLPDFCVPGQDTISSTVSGPEYPVSWPCFLNCNPETR